MRIEGNLGDNMRLTLFVSREGSKPLHARMGIHWVTEGWNREHFEDRDMGIHFSLARPKDITNYEIVGSLIDTMDPGGGVPGKRLALMKM
ncbi:hypothetical protein KJ765_02615 [Candidatus Micrarchaeota archaeon]|nr:hypothetical protein [Candidatus Micrarchaeota archaeon]